MLRKKTNPFHSVTPFTGVWIEIYNIILKKIIVFSCHSPYGSVWIEILFKYDDTVSKFVTPFAGVWIEIIKRYFSKEDLNMSLFS